MPRDEPALIPLDSQAACGACGYPLRGLRVGTACPECGRPVDLDGVAELDQTERDRASLRVTYRTRRTWVDTLATCLTMLIAALAVPVGVALLVFFVTWARSCDGY